MYFMQPSHQLPPKETDGTSPSFLTQLHPTSDRDVTNLHSTSCKVINKLLRIRNKCGLEFYDTIVGSWTVTDCCLVYS